MGSGVLPMLRGAKIGKEETAHCCHSKIMEPGSLHTGRIYSSGSRLLPKRHALEQAEICLTNDKYLLQSIFSPKTGHIRLCGACPQKSAPRVAFSLPRDPQKIFLPTAVLFRQRWPEPVLLFSQNGKTAFFPWIANIGAVHARPFALIAILCRVCSKAQQISAPIPVLAYDKHNSALLSVYQVSLLWERQTPPRSYSCAPASGSGACCMAISPVCPISSKTVSVAVTVTAPSSSSTWKRNPSTGRFSGISRRARL